MRRHHEKSSGQGGAWTAWPQRKAPSPHMLTLVLALACGEPSDISLHERPSGGAAVDDTRPSPAPLDPSTDVPAGSPDVGLPPLGRDPRTFGPRPPIPDPTGEPEPTDGAVLDPYKTFPLGTSDVIALARVESVEDVCDTGAYYDFGKADPLCNRQVVTFVVEDGLKGVQVGTRLIVLKQHTRISGPSHGPDDAWSAPQGELMLLMLQPANDLGIREPVYTRSHYPERIVRAAWLVMTPRGMTKPLLVNPYRNYYACTEEELVSLSPREAQARAQRLISSKEFQAPKGESPMVTYEREVNGDLKEAWADRSCDPAALGSLIRRALRSGAATGGAQ